MTVIMEERVLLSKDEISAMQLVSHTLDDISRNASNPQLWDSALNASEALENLINNWIANWEDEK